jgi:Beta-lactamase
VAHVEGLSGVIVVARPGRPATVVAGGSCTTGTRFQIGSVSKTFAATLVWMLVEDGDLSLDRRLVITGYGYGVYVGTYAGRSACLHTGDVPGYTSMLGWLPGDVHVICLSNDDTTRWEHHLPQLD